MYWEAVIFLFIELSGSHTECPRFSHNVAFDQPLSIFPCSRNSQTVVKEKRDDKYAVYQV